MYNDFETDIVNRASDIVGRCKLAAQEYSRLLTNWGQNIACFSIVEKWGELYPKRGRKLASGSGYHRNENSRRYQYYRQQKIERAARIPALIAEHAQWVQENAARDAKRVAKRLANRKQKSAA